MLPRIKGQAHFIARHGLAENGPVRAAGITSTGHDWKAVRSHGTEAS